MLQEEQGQLTTCPNDCSFHGVCMQETCHCDAGYSAEDCSYPVVAFVNFGVRSIDPPTGLALGGTRVFLTGFNLVESLVCRFEPIADISMPRLVAATFHNSTTVSCVAPPSAFVLSSVEEVATSLNPAPPTPKRRRRDPAPSPPAPTPPSYVVSELARAALHTPDTEYLLELALTPPHFTNNGMHFAQWDAALFSATPLGGPVRDSPSNLSNPPDLLVLSHPPATPTLHPLPRRSQVEGNTSVLVRGRGFRKVSQLQPQCRFGRTRVPATILGSGALRCHSPATLDHVVGPTGLSVSLDSSTELDRDWTQARCHPPSHSKPLHLSTHPVPRTRSLCATSTMTLGPRRSCRRAAWRDCKGFRWRAREWTWVLQLHTPPQLPRRYSHSLPWRAGRWRLYSPLPPRCRRRCCCACSAPRRPTRLVARVRCCC